MYAIIETGGKQYKVTKDGEVEVESLGKKEGSTVNIHRVLFISKGKKIYIGNPYLKKAKVVLEIIENKKDKKVIIFKYRKRKSSKSKKGHRQLISRVKVKDIKLDEDNL